MRDLGWFGYTVPFSETCDEDLPYLITQVQTTDAAPTDREYTEELHHALATAGLLPQTPWCMLAMSMQESW